MTIKSWHEEAIASHHHRTAFDCGDKQLNEFLRRYARQSHSKGTARTFLAISDNGEQRIFGYYSLSIATVAYAQTPEIIKRGLAHHAVPMFRLCKLAVDRSVQKQGFGGQLLLSAGRRCLQAANHVGGIGLLIDAKNPRVAEWYASYGALPLPDKPLSLILPFQTIRTALQSVEQP
ncbi:GNAT family N-acetyltransferase [Chlorobaculum sp. 24CR]|uniref:GNAT family N-acetyltransferase n=1 Tax=Chlorobaculum sp. 24CR TaxID=2508878 RepID=UPI00100C28E8|nr:GNAT family N-acetyltransferase [Chlorobaculum sp. 24CR]RXK85210.1 GNAT family N-acetyltransferase [Chlorobaculum sp. 24CR]